MFPEYTICILRLLFGKATKRAGFVPRIRKWTPDKIEKLIQQGYGQGEGKDYKPWIQIGDFSSKGRGSRIPGHKTGRVHHFLSDLESNYYHNVVWPDPVIDVREQYPLLPISETEEIAEELGIAHPKAPGSGISIPMTTDFLITVRNQNGTHLEARFVKYSKDLTNPRVQEKLTIEKCYWERRGVPFKIVTENNIHMEKVKSIRRILSNYQYADAEKLSIEEQRELAEEVIGMLLMPENRYRSLGDNLVRVSRQLGLEDDMAWNMFLYLAAHKIIPINLEERLVKTTPLKNLIPWDQIDETLVERGGEWIEHYA